MDDPKGESPDCHEDLKFLSDQPTEDDKIGIHRAIAENVKKAVMGDLPKPFVVGLFGSWGTGKSSIVKMLERATDRNFKLVLIDAWRKDRQNFLRQFIKKFARALLPKAEAEKVAKQVNFKTAFQETFWKPGPFAKAAFIIYLLTVMTLIGGIIYTWFNIHNDPSLRDFPLKEIGALCLPILAAIAFQWLFPKYSQQIQEKTEEVTIEDPAWFRKIYFEEILNRSSGISVCVVIDNLDRVPSDDALAIIKFVKTFVVDAEGEHVSPNKTKVTFLIPCDETELISRINSDSSISAPIEFLRKFINISIRVPSLLEQDNVGYIRHLLDQTGLRTDEKVRDNMAFIISRICRDNPRKPKTILNHFVARFNLAKNFPACWKIVAERPDWFLIHSILDSEFPETLPIESSEHLKQVSTSGFKGNQPRDGQTFLHSVYPIANEITPEAWHVFQFLKKPNVHDLIPGFREVVQFALDRNAEEFKKKFNDLRLQHPYLISDIWAERTDHPSRMAFAEQILSAHDNSTQKFAIPAPVLDDVAFMMRIQVSGWTSLPPLLTFDLVLRSRKDTLHSVLGSLNVTNFDSSDISKQCKRHAKHRQRGSVNRMKGA